MGHPSMFFSLLHYQLRTVPVAIGAEAGRAGSSGSEVKGELWTQRQTHLEQPPGGTGDSLNEAKTMLMPTLFDEAKHGHTTEESW